MAYGVMWAGTGAAGLIIPFVMNFLLQKCGFRTTLRIWAVALIIYFLKPRLPILPVSRTVRHRVQFLKMPVFWWLQIGLVIESLGFFVPGIYLPLFAKSLGLSTRIGTLLAALVNAVGVFSTIIMEMLIDRFHVTTVVMPRTVGTTLSVLLFWGFSDALPLLVVFSILYGFFAGGFVSTSASVLKEVKRLDHSEALVSGKPWLVKASFAYGSRYSDLIVFTGVPAAVGGVSFLGKRLGWM
jgi:cyanate permease